MAQARLATPIRQAGSQVQGTLLEVLVYGAYPPTMLISLAAVTRATGRLFLSLLPVCLLFTVPFILGVSLALVAGSVQAATVGQPLLVSLEHQKGGPTSWSLNPSPSYIVDVDGFRHPAKLATYWRIRPLAEGDHTLTFRSQGLSIAKKLKVGEGSGLASPVRYTLGLTWIVAPWEAPLVSGAQSITIHYPQKMSAWRGWAFPWWLQLLLGFLVWSWLLVFIPLPGNQALSRQPGKP